MCATTLKVVLPPWHTLPRITRNLNDRGHLAMKLSVGGTQSLNATCKLLIAEKTFYIYENRKFVENNIAPTNSSSLQSILPLPAKQREQKET